MFLFAAYSPSATGVLTVGQFGSYGYGSMTMERSFRVSDVILVNYSIFERAKLKFLIKERKGQTNGSFFLGVKNIFPPSSLI